LVSQILKFRSDNFPYKSSSPPLIFSYTLKCNEVFQIWKEVSKYGKRFPNMERGLPNMERGYPGP
jgi:hypothetical protein